MDTKTIAIATYRNRHGTPDWYATLVNKLTLPDSSTLRKQVAPTMDPIFQPTKHKTGSIIFLPEEYSAGGYAPATEGYFFKVTGHRTDSDNRPTCTLKWLTLLPTQPKYTTPHISITFRAVTKYASVLWANPAQPPEEEAEVDGPPDR